MSQSHQDRSFAARARTVGIVGAGQLARMTVEAASSLGIDSAVLAASETDPATGAASHLLIGEATDVGQLWALAARCDVITFDHEHVDLAMLSKLEEAGVAIRPATRSLSAGVDKGAMRSTLAGSRVPVVPYRLLDMSVTSSLEREVLTFAADHGWPLILKTARGGYDGKGVWQVEDRDQAMTVLRRLPETALVLIEPLVPIEMEIAVMVARRPGESRAWPAVETTQVEGICRQVLYPGRVQAGVARRATELALSIAERLGLWGVMAVEMFVTRGDVLVNELALRPHNSGHWTIEGSVTSQFENHLRAVFDLPLGSTEPVAPHVAMVNVLGAPDGANPAVFLHGALRVEGSHIHLYGKEPRPGRKLGHVTVTGDDPDLVIDSAWRATRALGAPTLDDAFARRGP
ncbi:MAG: 5-(carboxyamino)imidazole ribonucleotide synthase [Acidimicrobiales bacterium]